MFLIDWRAALDNLLTLRGNLLKLLGEQVHISLNNFLQQMFFVILRNYSFKMTQILRGFFSHVGWYDTTKMYVRRTEYIDAPHSASPWTVLSLFYYVILSSIQPVHSKGLWLRNDISLVTNLDVWCPIVCNGPFPQIRLQRSHTHCNQHQKAVWGPCVTPAWTGTRTVQELSINLRQVPVSRLHRTHGTTQRGEWLIDLHVVFSRLSHKNESNWFA